MLPNLRHAVRWTPVLPHMAQNTIASHGSH
jgi:hypothetical protein